jgi:hypothetical protein
MKIPIEFVDILENVHQFKKKEQDPSAFTWVWSSCVKTTKAFSLSSTKYIKKLVKNYKLMFGELRRQSYMSPLEKGDHPEVNTSDYLAYMVSNRTNQ